MAALLNKSLIKVCKWTKIWDKKHIISSYLGNVSNILTLPSIICVGKRSGGFKILSQYFTKMLSIPRFRAYRPIPSLDSMLKANSHIYSTLIKYLGFENVNTQARNIVLCGLSLMFTFFVLSHCKFEPKKAKW